MANLASVGRPYARAAFNYAHKKSELAKWKAFLSAAALVTKNTSVANLLKDLKFSSKKLFDLFESVLATLLDSEQKNFLLLLAQNKRLVVLPEISELFHTYCTQLEKMAEVRMVTAIAVDHDFKEKISQALTKRIQHEVTLRCDVDPDILGGAIIHFGDRVIDGSIKGQLARLLEFSLR